MDERVNRMGKKMLTAEKVRELAEYANKHKIDALYIILVHRYYIRKYGVKTLRKLLNKIGVTMVIEGGDA